MSVAILRQGDYLIASIQSDLSDSEVIELRHELTELVGRHRSRGIVIDVAALDVIDSFVTRALRSIVLTEAPKPSLSASIPMWRSRWCSSA
jgi:rsbT antagonist protein RsbS